MIKKFSEANSIDQCIRRVTYYSERMADPKIFPQIEGAFF